MSNNHSRREEDLICYVGTLDVLGLAVSILNNIGDPHPSTEYYLGVKDTYRRLLPELLELSEGKALALKSYPINNVVTISVLQKENVLLKRPFIGLLIVQWSYPQKEAPEIVLEGLKEVYPSRIYPLINTELPLPSLGLEILEFGSVRASLVGLIYSQRYPFLAVEITPKQGLVLWSDEHFRDIKKAEAYLRERNIYNKL